MLEGNLLKDKIQQLIADYVKEYEEKMNFEIPWWRTPIVGYADAKDPYIKTLKNVVGDFHKLPEDFMEEPNVVISYFIPFTKALAGTNIGVPANAASKEWCDSYVITNRMMGELNIYLAEEIEKLGYKAAVPAGVGMDEELVTSNWSQRHLAYLAGLGTFGINNMLITKEGCCGRFNSIVADIPVEPGKPLEQENCLYKSKGICKKCVKNCFSKALTLEGYDRHKCFDTCKKNLDVHGVDVCGKCITDVPCSFMAF